MVSTQLLERLDQARSAFETCDRLLLEVREEVADRRTECLELEASGADMSQLLVARGRELQASRKLPKLESDLARAMETLAGLRHKELLDVLRCRPQQAAPPYFETLNPAVHAGGGAGGTGSAAFGRLAHKVYAQPDDPDADSGLWDAYDPV